MSEIESSKPHAVATRTALSLQAIEEQTRALAAPLAGAPGAQVSLLCFRMGEERFALPAACVQRVFEVQTVRRVPHRQRPAFRGLVAHEGEILLLGSLERLLDLAPHDSATAAAPRMILIGAHGQGWAFQVDAVDGVFQVPQAELRPAPATLRRGLGTATRMLATIDGHGTALLDPESLVKGWEGAAS
jgi:chemotaxis signal transduction protein